MSNLIFIFLLSGAICAGGEKPRFICQNPKSFRTNDHSCADYNDVCIKTGDPDCANFQTACNQCPPSNYSIMMYIDMMNMKNQIIISKSQMKNLTDKVESNAGRTIKMIGLLIATLVVNLIFVLLLIVEVRFSIITRCLKIRKKKSSSSQKPLLDSTDNQNNLNQAKYQNYFENIKDLFDTKFTEMIGIVKNLSEIYSMQFQVAGSENLIKVKVSPEDTVVKVKRKIFHQIREKSLGNYKIMKMKCNEKDLEDNKCLLSQISFQPDLIIKCEFDETRKSNGILDLRIRDFNGKVKLYQFYKNQTVKDVKETLLPDGVGEAIVLKNTKKLENTDKLAKCDLDDDSLLTLIKSEHTKLSMNYMFYEDQKLSVIYCTTDPIKNILVNIANQMNTNKKNLVLFIDRLYLDAGKYLYEYGKDIQNQPVQVCIMKRFCDIELQEQIYSGSFYKFHEALEKTKKEKILIKKYQIGDLKLILKELAVFQITKSCSRFIQISNVYSDDSSIYVAIEYMSQGVMAEYLSHIEGIDIRMIQKWSRQILEGLQFLHQNDTIVRDLNPTSILIDANDDVKLFNLNFSKYTDYSKPSSSIKKCLFVRYLAPEILKEMIYDSSADIWSFGALVFKLESGKELYADLDNDKAVKSILEYSNIQFKLSRLNFKELESFISNCLKSNPMERASITQLISHSFLAKNSF